jgi:hypothetical protein
MRRMRSCQSLSVCFAIAMASASQGVLALAFEAIVIDPNASGDNKAAADIDGDGDDDAILGGGSLVWYRSAGAVRSFERFVIRAQPVNQEFTTDMDTGDVDGDGDIDLVTGDGNGAGNLLWFENPRLAAAAGLGNDPTVAANWRHHVIGTQGDWVHDLALGYVDSDGRLDVASAGHGRLALWQRDASGTWGVTDLSVFSGSGVALGDLDGNGFDDVVTAGGWIENPSGVNGASWRFWPIDNANPGDGPALAIADVNQDGRTDILSAPQHRNGTFAWFQAPTALRQAAWPRRIIDVAQGSHHLRLADFDGDGVLDVLTGLERADLSVYLNRGVFGWDRVLLAMSGGHNAVLGDFDADGRLDVLAADYIGFPPLRVYWNLGESIADRVLEDGFETR